VKKYRKIIFTLLFGIALGWLFVSPPVRAAETSAEAHALERIASILDKLLDAVKDGSWNQKEIICACKCEK
jgi:hypothetical protein